MSIHGDIPVPIKYGALFFWLLSVQKCIANLYCICLIAKICGMLKQVQYRFAVDFGTLIFKFLTFETFYSGSKFVFTFVNSRRSSNQMHSLLLVFEYETLYAEYVLNMFWIQKSLISLFMSIIFSHTNINMYSCLTFVAVYKLFR